MNKKLLLALALSASSFSAFAADNQLGYTSVELGYQQNRINTGFRDSNVQPGHAPEGLLPQRLR